MQPAHPADSSLAARRRRARRARLRGRRPHRRPAHRRRRSPTPTCSSSPTRPTRSGRRPSTAARRCFDRRRDRRDRGLRRAPAAASIVLGETEQDKYGNNLNELLARFGIEIENATVQDYEHHHATRRPGSSPTLGAARRRRAAGADLARRRRRAPASTAPARSRTDERRPRHRPHPRRPPSLPERAARRGHRPRRRPRRRARRLRPLRRRLHRRARPPRALAQPRLLGRRSRAFAARRRRAALAAAADPAWPRLQGRGRGAAPDPGARRLGRHRRATTPTSCATSPPRSPTSAQALAPRFPHQADYIDALARRPARLGRRRLRASPTSTARSRPSAPSASAATAIEHLVVFPMYKQNASRDTCFEALIVRVPWPEWVAELERDPLRQRRSSSRSPSSTTPPATTPSARSSSPRRSRPPSAPPTPLRRDLLRPRGRALPPRLRRRRRDRCASTCRPTPPACSRSRRALRDAYIALGPDPRPHPHARRPARSTRS